MNTNQTENHGFFAIDDLNFFTLNTITNLPPVPLPMERTDSEDSGYHSLALSVCSDRMDCDYEYDEWGALVSQSYGSYNATQTPYAPSTSAGYSLQG